MSADGITPRTCPIAAGLEVLGERWSLLVLREIAFGEHRFDRIRAFTGAPRDVLTARLRTLEEHGVIDRVAYSERPPRFEYRLTHMGAALSPTLVALMRWGDEWLSDDGPPTVLVHEACGHPLDQAFVCWHCDETFTQSGIASRPGRRFAGVR